MATTSYTIYSHYDPIDREILERETGQTLPEEVEEAAAESWDAEAASTFKRRLAGPPPTFVPATIPHNDWSNQKASSSSTATFAAHQQEDEVAGWYKSLTQKSDTPSRQTKSNTNPVATHPTPSERGVLSSGTSVRERRNKNNWFIINALQSEQNTPSSSRSSSTLADILARDPPPLPSQEKFTPPVWLAIGPSNKGFAMLQQSGWNEGEALGPDAIRHKRHSPSPPPRSHRFKGKAKAVESAVSIKQETIEVEIGEDDDVKEVRQVSVIDLTMSDSESEASHDEDEEESKQVSIESSDADDVVPSEYPSSSTLLETSSIASRTALLTPIATVLKSDRLGIGLKAKTVGPYKASQKRITHNAAALAAHIRAAEEIKKRKAEHGRGRRGLERQWKKDEDRRRAMLAYLNE